MVLWLKYLDGEVVVVDIRTMRRVSEEKCRLEHRVALSTR
jgi:hypothetical protein